MKHLAVPLALLLILSAHTCKNGTNGATGLLDRKWVFRLLNGAELNLPDGVDTPWLQLTGDQLSGFGGCNNLMGSYTLGDGTISFPGLGSTKKFCEGVQPTENAIKQALGQVDGYKLEGGLLKLLGGGKELAALKAE